MISWWEISRSSILLELIYIIICSIVSLTIYFLIIRYYPGPIARDALIILFILV